MSLAKLPRKIFSWINKRENLFLVVFFFIIFSVLLINTFHEEYPDEFDNILGGWYITHGIPIYTGFFTHHGPVAYFIAALITLLSGNSFVLFRVIFSLVIFVYLLWSYSYIKSRFGKERTYFYLIFIALISLAGNYYWFHMLLADTLSAYFFAPVITLLLLVTISKTPLIKKDIIIISILTAFSVLSSLTFIYFSIIVYAYALYWYLQSNSLKIFSRKVGVVILIFAAPYLLFLTYLLVTFSLQEYIYQGWIFNQRYYVYNYPRPEGSLSINPVRFAIVIAHNFYNSYFTLLEQVKTFNLNFPLNITFAVGTLGTIFYLLIRRQFLFAIIFTGLLIYANARSDPLNSKETDYQAAVYIMMALVSTPFLLLELYRDLNNEQKIGRNLIYGVIFLTVSIYSLFSTMFLFQKFFNRTYDKYMGKAPLIYDRPIIAPVINRLIAVNEPVWVGPFEFKELFYIHGRPASKYHIFIPGMGYSPEIRSAFIEELEKSKPSIIYFQKNFFILGRSPEMYGQFFLDYLQKHYVTLQQLNENERRYISLVPVTDKIDLETRLYIRKEKLSSVLEKLIANQFVASVNN
ncbi:MAG: hypothetical protein KatS3mg089_0391 [Patescibacteria group bacterium]|nr:MAG: hypothetical protein KatS3mg089_0391 [Patescibacteria group bacterium]